MVSLKASYLRPVFLHSDQVIFLVLLVPVVLKASYFRETRRIHPWRCQAGYSSLRTPACTPAVCTEPPPFQRAAQPDGQTHGRPVRGIRRPRASEEAQQHGPCSAGSPSGRRAEPTGPSSTAARHPAGTERPRSDTGAACPAVEPRARTARALQQSLTAKHHLAAFRL